MENSEATWKKATKCNKWFELTPFGEGFPDVPDVGLDPGLGLGVLPLTAGGGLGLRVVVVVTGVRGGHDCLQNPQLPWPPICSNSLSTFVEHQNLQVKIDLLQNTFYRSHYNQKYSLFVFIKKDWKDLKKLKDIKRLQKLQRPKRPQRSLKKVRNGEELGQNKRVRI